MAACERRRFANRTARLVPAAFFALLVLIGVGLLSSNSRSIAGLGYIAAGVPLAIRALTSSTVDVGDGVITTRSMVRTRRHPLSQIRAARVNVGRTGFAGYIREYLVFERADGSGVASKELNSKPHDDSVVRMAAALINECLAAGESGGGC